jgi:actin beta/gamma 1
MFETFNVPAMYGSVGAALSVYASSRTTGCVVECGDGVAHVAPVYEGYVVRDAIVRVAVGGADVTEHMRTLFFRRRSEPIMTVEHGILHSYATTTVELEIMRHIKETMAYVAMDVDKELETYLDKPYMLDKPYTLPDGTVIELGSERFDCPEVLFNPRLIGKEAPGIHKCTVEAINKCSADTHRNLYSNIVLSGGGTLFPGLGERLSKEISALAPAPPTIKKVEVIAPPERKYTAWIGGSMLASLSTFQSMWISKAEYDESGTSIIHRKCFL